MMPARGHIHTNWDIHVDALTGSVAIKACRGLGEHPLVAGSSAATAQG